MKRRILLLSALILSVGALEARTWHVSATKGSDRNDATAESPIKTISKAARLAISGDTVLISGGVYRERVSPANGGIFKDTPIVYMPVEGEKVEIKGSEIVTGWKSDKSAKGIYRCTVSNDMFGDFNPFEINLYGDWYLGDQSLHLGDLYLNGESLLEVAKDKLAETPNSWYAEVYDDETVIFANFDRANPAKGVTEVNVRPTCFFPERTGVNYITVRGLHLSQAATQWAPPTAEQVGLIGPNWSKGWVIEDCVISHSKCVGICLGKHSASGQNLWVQTKDKMPYVKLGFNREIEAIFKAYDLGWSKENIGSHKILNNKIFKCHQAGIVGHLGCAFSEIRGNEIYDINNIEDIWGHEAAGIKLHAAIDVIIDHNLIYNCRRGGIWLDWQAQGAQVCNNVIYDSRSEDLFLEVSHGPTLVYNNVFLSKQALLVDAHGVAFFNNIFNGDVIQRSSTARYTPYHAPHSTKIRGLYNNTGGDIRFYNNVFVAGLSNSETPTGLSKYDSFPVCTPAMSAGVGQGGMLAFKFPVWATSNVYFNGAPAYVNEEGSVVSDKSAKVTFDKSTGYVTLEADKGVLSQVKGVAINTNVLGRTMISEQMFENPDETPFSLTKDMLGNSRNELAPAVGAFEGVMEGRVW